MNPKLENSKEVFKISGFDFGIDKYKSKIRLEGNIIHSLIIKANEDVFDQYCKNEDNEFCWFPGPPELHINGIKLDEDYCFEITDDNWHNGDFDAVIYFCHHHWINGRLRIKDDEFEFKGISEITDIKQIEIKMNVTQQ